MRIAIINITSGGISGGYRKYLLEVIPRLDAHQMVKEILCVSPPLLETGRWFAHLNKVKFLECLIHPLSIDTNSYLRKSIIRFSPDIIFIPTERYLRFGNIPVVNMIQNMEPFSKNKITNNFSINLKLAAQRKIGRSALKKSDGVIAISGFVKNYLINDLCVPREKISLVYHGISDAKNKEKKPPSIFNDWSDDFIFTAGSIRPARGLEDIVNALHQLKNSGIMLHLVIAGEINNHTHKYYLKLKSMVDKYKLSNFVIWAGGLNDKEMSWCYNNSKLFVITSRVESFGMIAGEAMANGCVCISSDNPCLPEIFGDAAVYYNTNDGKDLAEKIQKILNWDTSKFNLMSSSAKVRAKYFSWNICVERIVGHLMKTTKSTGCS